VRKVLGPAVLLLGILVAVPGCSGSADEAPPKITAPVDNNAPGAANAPSAELGESPGELAKRMGGQGGMAKKMAPK
jgi:hypothetical protein